MDYEALAKQFGGSLAPTVPKPEVMDTSGLEQLAKSMGGSMTQSGIPQGRRSYDLAEVPGQWATTIGPSAKKFAGGIAEAVMHPIDTVGAVTKLGAGALYHALPEPVQKFWRDLPGDPAKMDEVINMASAAGGELKDRWGSYEGAKRTLAEDPVGALSDISTLFTGGAAAAGKVGMAKTATTLGNVAKATDPLVLATAPVLGPLEASRGAKMATQQAQNAVRDANIAAAKEAGYTFTPGSISPTGKNILSERIAGKTHLEQLASVKNQNVTDKLARQAADLPDTAPLTTATMQNIRKEEYLKGYEPIKQIGNIASDNTYLNDLVNIEGKYVGPNRSFPGAVPPDVEKLIQNYTVSKFDSADAVNASRKLREESTASFSKGENEIAHAKRDLANALEAQIGRALQNPGNPAALAMLQQFNQSRQRMAISHAIEDAIKEGTGSVDAKKLAASIQRGDYMSGELKTIAEFANAFPRTSNMPGTIGAPGASTLLGATGGGVGAVTGALLGGGPMGAGFGAAIGAASPQLMSGAMRQYLLSPVGQNRMMPSYNTQIPVLNEQAMRNALLMSQSGQLQERNKLRQK